MYLEHFGLEQPPFTITPDTDFFLNEGCHNEALNVLFVALSSGEGFIKVTGEVGTGKTLLCGFANGDKVACQSGMAFLEDCSATVMSKQYGFIITECQQGVPVDACLELVIKCYFNDFRFNNDKSMGSILDCFQEVIHIAQFLRHCIYHNNSGLRVNYHLAPLFCTHNQIQ